MRHLPNEFARTAAATGYPRPATVALGLPVLVALSPLLLAWWAGLAVAVGGTALLRGAPAPGARR